MYAIRLKKLCTLSDLNMVLLEFYGFRLDYSDKYPDYIKAIGERDVLRVDQEYLHPERFVPVIVADLKEANIKS